VIEGKFFILTIKSPSKVLLRYLSCITRHNDDDDDYDEEIE
jgi:hypothetical protein